MLGEGLLRGGKPSKNRLSIKDIMKRWKKIIINNEEFIFFIKSLCLVKNSMEFEETLKSVENGNISKGSEYQEIIPSILKQDDLFGEYINSSLISNHKKETKLLGIEINTINACNMKCKYCFAVDGTHNKKFEMTEEQAKDSIDFLFEHAAARKTLYITIIGGEPFLNIGLFKYIVLYAEEKAKENNKKVRFFTTTNGTILDESLKKFLDEHLVNLMLSYDSQFPEIQNLLRPMKNGQGSWENMKDNFSYFKQRPKSTVHITLTPYNYALYEYAKYCYNAGFSCVHFDIVKSKQNDLTFTEEQIQEVKTECSKLAKYVADEIEKGNNISVFPIMDNIWGLHKRIPKLNSCAVPYGQCCIGPDGNIYPCDVLMWDKYCLGNIEKKRYNPAQYLYYEEHNECKNCWARYLCGGQCLADKVQADAEFQRMYCDFKRHICKLQLYIFYRLSKSGDYIKKYIMKKEEEYGLENK